MKIIAYETESKVGIFWFTKCKVDGKEKRQFIYDDVNVDDAEDYGQFKIYGGDHITFWDDYIKKYDKELKAYEYDDFPRGRVVLDLGARIFIIYMDNRLSPEKSGSNDFEKKVLSRFHLTEKRHVFDYSDAHYRSKFAAYRMLRDE